MSQSQYPLNVTEQTAGKIKRMDWLIQSALCRPNWVQRQCEVAYCCDVGGWWHYKLCFWCSQLDFCKRWKHFSHFTAGIYFYHQIRTKESVLEVFLWKLEWGSRLCECVSVCVCVSQTAATAAVCSAEQTHSEPWCSCCAAWAGMRAALCRLCGSEGNNTRSLTLPASSCSLPWEKFWSQYPSMQRAGVTDVVLIHWGQNVNVSIWVRLAWFASEAASLVLTFISFWFMSYSHPSAFWFPYVYFVSKKSSQH